MAVYGVLKQERWEKDGVKRSKHVIEVRDLKLIGPQVTPKETPPPSDDDDLDNQW